MKDLFNIIMWIEILRNPITWTILGVLIVIYYFIEYPILWLVLVICLAGAIHSGIKEEKLKEEKQKKYKNKAKKQQNTYIRKVKNPFTEAITIDEEIDVAPFIKVRDAISKVNIKTITPANLYLKLTEIEDIAEMRIFRTDNTALKDLKDLYEKLIEADLDNKKSITLRKLFDVDDNDAREYEEEYMPYTKSHSSTKDLEEDVDIDENDLSVKDSLALGAVGYMVGKELDKNDKLNELRKEVKELEKEYEFERRYDPSWDTDECLSSKYKDEEQYLRARKEELQRKNLAYNNYLDPREREYLNDESEGFYYE